MKKKGLIISTVVMVVVLIASLTTATYAWFTTTPSSTIDNITVSVAAGADVLIGVTPSGKIVNSATHDSFVSGSLTAKHGAYTPSDGATVEAVASWTGDDGMSGHINTGLSLSQITQATATGKMQDNALIVNAKDAQWTTTPEKLVKASGHNTVITPGTLAESVENWDYLHFTLGAVPNKETVDKIILNMTVNPTDKKKILGMTAAMHVVCSFDGTTWTDINVYDEKTINYDTLKTDTKLNNATTLGAAVGNTKFESSKTELNAGWQNIQINWGDAGTAIGTGASAIKQIEIYIYYSGVDKDCVDAAVGSSATVYFTLLNTNGAKAA